MKGVYMEVTITARNLELTKAIHDYALQKIQKTKKLSSDISDAHIILSVRKYTQIAEVIMKATGVTLRAKEEAGDLYAAIDIVIDNISRQLKKHNEKLKKCHHIHRDSKMKRNISNMQIGFNEDIDECPSSLRITETKSSLVKPMHIPEAINQMNSLQYKFLIFYNTRAQKLQIVYVKEDDTYGIIEPDTSSMLKKK